MQAQPFPQAPQQASKKPGPSLGLSLTLLFVGILIAVPCAIKGIAPLIGGFTKDPVVAPLDTRMHFSHGTYLVYERDDFAFGGSISTARREGHRRRRHDGADRPADRRRTHHAQQLDVSRRRPLRHPFRGRLPHPGDRQTEHAPSSSRARWSTPSRTRSAGSRPRASAACCSCSVSCCSSSGRCGADARNAWRMPTPAGTRSRTRQRRRQRLRRVGIPTRRRRASNGGGTDLAGPSTRTHRANASGERGNQPARAPSQAIRAASVHNRSSP